MSRLIVKNLPVYVTPAKLRQHFEQQSAPVGAITDVKVSLKLDGTSRRFGFVGYKSEREALVAQKWFDRTFIDSTRISVNITEVSLGVIPTSLIADNGSRERKMHQLRAPTSVDA